MNFLIKISIISFILMHCHFALASMLPQQYQLRPHNEGVEVVEPNLQKWFDSYAKKQSFQKLTVAEKDLLMKERDEVTKSFVRLWDLRKTNPKLFKAKAKQFIDDAELWLEDEKRRDHLLMPYLVGEILETGAQSDKLSRYLAESAPASCPHKIDLQRKLSDPQVVHKDTAGSLDGLRQLQMSKSKRFRYETLRRFLHIVPAALYDTYRPQVLSYDEDLRSLKTKHSWLGGDKTDVAVTGFLKGLADAKKLAKKRRCKSAEKLFVGSVEKMTNIEFLDDTLKVARSVANCYRRYGSKRRIESWRRMQPILTAKFNFPGWAAAELNVARYLWNLDEFKQAISSVTQVIEKGKKLDDKIYRADAAYLLARIYENKLEYDAAIKSYQEFIKNFPKHDKVNKALSAVMMMHAGRQNWPQTISAAKEIINRQDELKQDDREVSVLGFALFWMGRAYFEQERTDFAKATWHRLATEFYSTYYGAMGHYLLEQLEGQSLHVYPSFARKFERESLTSKFSAVDQRRIQRIEKLLELGLKNEARCEISELDTSSVNDTKVYKAMLLYAADQWLAAIKLYSNLPRTLRDQMPVGMEMMLFPKRFEMDINEYAGRLGVDPDFVFALIRQESVFNPKARSSAGATGLMQLMKHTARIEARKLSREYVSPSKRRNLMAKTRRSNNLFDAKTNLILGTHHLARLLKDYGGPVLTLSAYNAGPGAANKWVRRFPTNDLLFFIEKIPYQETRGYVKLILRNYFYYKRWYNSGDESFPHLDDVTRPLLSLEHDREKVDQG